WAAHPRGHPARVDGVAEHIRPYAGDRNGERCDEEFAVRVGARCAAAPVDAVEFGSPAAVCAAAEVDEALRLVDERGEQVGGDDVDGQDLRAGVDAGVWITASMRPRLFTSRAM